MPKVLCTLENASEEINGFKFTPTEGGMLSEDLDDEAAQTFLSIPGYEPADDAAPPAAKATTTKPAPTPPSAKGARSSKKAAEAPAPAPAPAAEQESAADGAGDAGASGAEGGAGGPGDDESTF